MCAIPQPTEDWPCSAMYHEDENSGAMSLMFERPLSANERYRVRHQITTNSHWLDEQTLFIPDLAFTE